MTRIYRTIAGDVLDDICWRHYGRHAGAVESVLAANPGLAAHGAELPADIDITLPVLETPEPESVVRLWS